MPEHLRGAFSRGRQIQAAQQPPQLGQHLWGWGRLKCDGGDLLAQHAYFFAVEHKHDAHKELKCPCDGEPHIVEWILPEYVQLQCKNLDVSEACEFENLLQAVFGHVVKVIDVVRDVFRADERVCAVHRINDDAAAGAQRAAAQF